MKSGGTEKETRPVRSLLRPSPFSYVRRQLTDAQGCDDPVSRPVGRDPGRDGTGFFKGIFEKTRPIEMVQKTFGIASLILKILTYTLNTFFKTLLREIGLNLKHILNELTN